MPRAIPQHDVPQMEWMTSWGRAGWDPRKRKSRKFSTLKAAQHLANKLASGERDGLPPATDIQIRQRIVGEWRVIARKDGAR